MVLQGLWGQARNSAIAQNGLVFEKVDPGDDASKPTVPREFGDLTHGGLSVELWLELENAAPGQTLFSTMDGKGRGVRVQTSELGGALTLAIELGDGARSAIWHTDPGAILTGKPQHALFICDFSAAVVSVVVNGVFLDGGTLRQYGWGRLPLELNDVKGSFQALLTAPVKTVRLYQRALRTSEAVGNFKAGSQNQ